MITTLKVLAGLFAAHVAGISLGRFSLKALRWYARNTESAKRALICAAVYGIVKVHGIRLPYVLYKLYREEMPDA